MTWVVVLIKDFSGAKSRLGPALTAEERERLARENALRALEAARAGDHVLAVAGGEAAAELARLQGVEVLLEPRAEGQNPAARRGLDHAVARGAQSALLLSSDLPLVTRRAVRALLRRGAALERPAVLAAAATGRGGTNALYLAPPDACGLHFGDDSLRKFAADARRRGATFEVVESPALALDLDEPSDLELLERVS